MSSVALFSNSHGMRQFLTHMSETPNSGTLSFSSHEALTSKDIQVSFENYSYDDVVARDRLEKLIALFIRSKDTRIDARVRKVKQLGGDF